MDTPQLYIACLASYNSGLLFGAWIRADQSASEIQDEIQNMLAKSPVEDSEEWALHDYEGFGSIKLSEYEDLETVVAYVEFIAEHGELGAELIANYGIEEAETMLEERYHGEHDSEVDFARMIFDDCYSGAIPENLSWYFDYDAFARDLFINDFFAVEALGQTHVFSNY